MKKHIPDALMIVGAASASYGAYLAWPPAGAIVGGILLIVAGIMIARSS